MNKLVKLLLVFTLLLSISACSKSDIDDENIVKLSFKDATSYEDLKALDGQTVTISGYMATSSPVDGSFIFLMNMPYQSCPFCQPNTSTLSNTMEIMPKSGESFSYTNQAIKVVGTLVVAESEEEQFEDDYGYQFSFKIVDGQYTILKDNQLSKEMQLFQELAASDVINEIYNMYNFVNFLCCWPTYSYNSYEDEEGNYYPGGYLYPGDAVNAIITEGAQFNYGYQEGYFDSIINTIKNVDSSAFNDLVENVVKAYELSEKAMTELAEGNYTYEEKYLEEFDNTDLVFTLNKGQELEEEWFNLYQEFAIWLAKWEM